MTTIVVRSGMTSGHRAPAALEDPRSFVIAVGDHTHPSSARCDVVVSTARDADRVAAAVRVHPDVARILSDMLRSIEEMPTTMALTVESLAYAVVQGSADHARWLAGRPPARNAAPPGMVRVDRDGDVLSVVLDRPQAFNAVDRAMRDALTEAFTVALVDPDIRSVRLSGRGRAFCVGADLSEFGTTRDPATAHSIRSVTLPAHVLARIGERLHVHVHGACVGAGIEMAAFAGRLTAHPRSWFQLPELGMGLIPGAGGCVSVSARIGRLRTAYMVLSGRRIDARTALSWGLVDALTEDPPW